MFVPADGQPVSQCRRVNGKPQPGVFIQSEKKIIIK